MPTPLSMVFDTHEYSRLPPSDAVSFEVKTPQFDDDVSLAMTELDLTRAFRTTLNLLRSATLDPGEQDILLAKRDAIGRGAPAWSPWLSLMYAWALRFCFLAGDCGDLDATMLTQITHLDNVGIELRFVLSNSIEPDTYAEREWFGDYMQDTPDRAFNWTEHKLCMCIALRVPDNAVDWDELERLYLDNEQEVSNATTSQRLIRSLHEECDKVKCAHAVIMDSEHTLILVIPKASIYFRAQPRRSMCQLFRAHEHSAAFCIAQIISKYSPSLNFTGPIYHRGVSHLDGATWHPAHPTRFRDFDYYELSQGGNYLQHFLKWKERQSAIVSSICVGDVLPVTGRYVLPRQLLRWRNRFPRHPLEKQDRMQMNAWTKRRRPRDRTTDDLLLNCTSPALAFRVTGVIQDGPEHYSRVVRGRLDVPGTSVSSAHTLVLKLFDERFFPVKQLQLFLEGDAKFWVNFADQLLRREDSAYRRLRKFQGSLIPQYYGSHEVRLADGCKVLAVLLEDISGTTAESAINKLELYEDIKKFHSCVRGFIRALNHCGITQTDWHEDQIICEPYTMRNASGGFVECYRPVFLDFAFATQSSGRNAMMEEPDDVARVGMLLCVIGDLEDDLQWYQRDLCE